MASACINNIAQDKTLFDGSSSSSYPCHDWFNPRENPPVNLHSGDSAMEISGDFEFRLEEDPATMLPADELFSEGKLVPLQMAAASRLNVISDQIRSLDLADSRRISETFVSDTCGFSAKAPSCSSKWKTLLNLKKLQNPKHNDLRTSKNTNASSLKSFLHRNHKPSPSTSNEPSPSLPLLRDRDFELSNAFDLPDQDPKLQIIEPPKLRLVKSVPRVPDSANGDRVIPIDSPRMNSSGKVVFKHLERSSSSPSSFNGGGRTGIKYKGMERSHSANVRITRVLNVPLCSSLRGSLSKSSSSGSSMFGFSKLFSSSSHTTKREEGTLARKKPN